MTDPSAALAFEASVRPVRERLADRRCVPCRGGIPPLTEDAWRPLLAELDEVGRGWQVVDGHHLVRELDFPDFASALSFTNRVGALAEELGHHPDLQLRWGRVVVTVFTHKIGGLSESDFILAARIEQLPR